jgi:putative SOS response-associated peptidase YedK
MLAVRWGLIPPWSKDEKVGYKLINAQAESLREKPTFRDVFVLAILAAHKNV